MKKEKKAPAVTLDPELVLRAKEGDVQAWSALYEATYQQVYQTIRLLVKDGSQAEDIQQETYIKAFTHMDQMKDPESFLPWLRRIAANEAKNHLKRKSPTLFTDLAREGEEYSVPEIPDKDQSKAPEAALENKERSEQIRRILDSLTDEQRMIVGMYYYEQIPIKQIAEQLGLRQGTIKIHLHRSRKKVELEVERLEREEGIRLFSAGALPFVISALTDPAPEPFKQKKILAGILKQAAGSGGSVSAVSTAAGAGLAAAGLYEGRRFFQTALGKAVLGLAVAGAITGGIFGIRMLQKQKIQEPLGDIQPVQVTEAPEPVEDVEIPEHIHNPVKDHEPKDETELLVQNETEQKDNSPDKTETKPTESEPPTVKQEEQDDPEASDRTQDHQTTENEQENDVKEQHTPEEESEQSETTNDNDPTEGQGNVEQRVVSCSWSDSTESELYDIPWGSFKYVEVITEGDAVPTVYTDNYEVVQLRSNDRGKIITETGKEQMKYSWLVTAVGSGTAHIYCEYNFQVTHVLTVVNPEYPEIIISFSAGIFHPSYAELPMNSFCRVMAVVQGYAEPTVYTDNPEVVSVVYYGRFYGSETSWIHLGYDYDVFPLTPGTAHLYCVLNGKTEGMITITVPEEQTETAEASESTEPIPMEVPSSESSRPEETTTP